MAFTAKDAKVLRKRSTPPGVHGLNRARLSEFAVQLREKQKCKINYGVQEKQFKRAFNKAKKMPGVTGDNLIRTLEMRLDNVVFRLGFAETRYQARQLVNHGFFQVNGKKVDVPSFSSKVGDQIMVREVKRKTKYIQSIAEKIKNFHPQDWVSLDPQKLSGKVLSVPTPQQVGNQINTQLIVEHYSRI